MIFFNRKDGKEFRLISERKVRKVKKIQHCINRSALSENFAPLRLRKICYAVQTLWLNFTPCQKAF